MNSFFRSKWRLAGGLAIAAMLAAFAIEATSTSAVPGVDPAVVEVTLNPGDSVNITKTVTTPEIPPQPDVCFLADTTGSMAGAIANVKTNATSVMNTVIAAQPDAQFCVADYKDFNCDANPYTLGQAITATVASAQTAINAWAAGGGCDTPESQLNALNELATNPAVGFRASSTRVIAWFGDAVGHDPSNGVTLAAAIAALQAADIKVIAIDVGNLNGTGQAAAITAATGGVLLPAGGDVSAAILTGLANLPAEVIPVVGTCDPAISLTFTPASQTVTSGDQAVFDEQIDISAGAPQGTTITCEVDWQVNGVSVGTQTITVHVRDITAPTASCTPTTNPAGKQIPTAGTNPKSGQNPDGFYQLGSTDNVDTTPSIFVIDSASAFVAGPFANGDKVKITQAPGVTPSVSPMAGVIIAHIKLKGDAIVVAVDDAGNFSFAFCLVPPKPK